MVSLCCLLTNKLKKTKTKTKEKPSYRGKKQNQTENTNGLSFSPTEAENFHDRQQECLVSFRRSGMLGSGRPGFE